eukprot:scaffold59465_cov63-Phaeocystis_antarctica.AAC.1
MASAICRSRSACMAATRRPSPVPVASSSIIDISSAPCLERSEVISRSCRSRSRTTSVRSAMPLGSTGSLSPPSASPPPPSPSPPTSDAAAAALAPLRDELRLLRPPSSLSPPLPPLPP